MVVLESFPWILWFDFKFYLPTGCPTMILPCLSWFCGLGKINFKKFFSGSFRGRFQVNFGVLLFNLALFVQKLWPKNWNTNFQKCWKTRKKGYPIVRKRHIVYFIHQEMYFHYFQNTYLYDLPSHTLYTRPYSLRNRKSRHFFTH